MRRGVVVIIIAQLHSTKPELRFCAGSNLAFGMSEICDGENFWRWSRLEIRLNGPRRSTIPQKQFHLSAVVVPTGVPLKTLSPKTVSSWLYLLIFTFVKSRLCWLRHISLFFLWDWHETFLALSQTKWEFLYDVSLCVSHFSVQIFIVSIPNAVILENFSFLFI